MLKVDKRGRMKRIIEVNIGCLFYLMLVFRLVEGIKEKEKNLICVGKLKIIVLYYWLIWYIGWRVVVFILFLIVYIIELFYIFN